MNTDINLLNDFDFNEPATEDEIAALESAERVNAEVIVERIIELLLSSRMYPNGVMDGEYE